MRNCGNMIGEDWRKQSDDDPYHWNIFHKQKLEIENKRNWRMNNHWMQNTE